MARYPTDKLGREVGRPRKHRGMPVAPPARPIEPLPPRARPDEPFSPFVDRSNWQNEVNPRFWILLWLGMLALTAAGVAWTIGWRP